MFFQYACWKLKRLATPTLPKNSRLPRGAPEGLFHVRCWRLFNDKRRGLSKKKSCYFLALIILVVSENNILNSYNIFVLLWL
jgi:hypothetical protein